MLKLQRRILVTVSWLLFLQVKTFSISLHGLLDYDETDRDEPTFELSVFAEAFQEMLMRDYGTLVFNALMNERYVGGRLSLLSALIWRCLAPLFEFSHSSCHVCFA